MTGFATRTAAGRRRFLKLVGLAGISSAVSSSMLAWAQTRPATPGAAPTPAAAPADTARAATPPPEISDDARALAAILDRRYGKHLKPAQLEAITREIENRLQGGKRLREVKLANRDEPDFTFRA